MSFTTTNTFIPWDPRRALKDTRCAACGSAGAYSQCGGCQFAKFCGVECQRAAWGSHESLCVRGFSGYISSLEAHQQRVAPLVLADDNAGAIACYTEALDAARAFGDAEGVRHLLRTLAQRCDALDRKADSAKHTAEANAVEAIIGRPSSAKQVFGFLDGLPLPGQQPPAELSSLSCPSGAVKPRERQVRGAKRGKLPWCTWEQTVTEMTVTVPLPADVPRKSIEVSYRRQGLSVSLKGGIVVAEVELNGRVQQDECTWTVEGGAALIVLEKAEKKVWDWLTLEAPKEEVASTAADSAASAAASVAALDVSDAEARTARATTQVAASQLAATLTGLAAPEPDAERLMDAAIVADLAPPRPAAVATGPTPQADSGTGTGSAGDD